ncbi:hypothetical protein TSAR_006247, partial [Trichomalopsis sarcophagae]
MALISETENDIAGLKNLVDANTSECINEPTRVLSECFQSENKKIKSTCNIDFEGECNNQSKLNKSDYGEENSKNNNRFSSDGESSTNDSDDSSENEEENKNFEADCPIVMVLRECPYIPTLPLSSKTLLKFKSLDCYKIEKFDKNDIDNTYEFLYCGISKQLQKTINPKLHETLELEVQFHIDGLPIYQSSSKEFWPILGKVSMKSIIYEPFIVAVYCGTGVDIEEINFKIKVKCFVCDRPARSFVKCIKGHTGLQTNIEHHNDVSPLTLVEPQIDMVNHFVLDFMHLGCLGVTKKLLEYWTGTGSAKL